MRRVTSLVAVMAAATMALAACGGGSSSSSTSSSGGAASATSNSGPKLKVGLAYDIGGRGDKSFNDSAAAGLDKAKAELGIEYKELSATQGETDADKEARLKLLAQGGYNPVIAVGFLYGGAMKKVAAAFPKTQFAIIDSVVDGAPNVTGLTFAEHEGSYLVGVAAALSGRAVIALLVLLVQNDLAPGTSGTFLAPSKRDELYGFSEDTFYRGTDELAYYRLVSKTSEPVRPAWGKAKHTRSTFELRLQGLDRSPTDFGISLGQL